MFALNRPNRLAIALAASSVVALLAVWLVLFNGSLVSDGGLLAHTVPYLVAMVCLATAAVHFFVARTAYSSRVALLAVSALAGIALPALAAALPVVFCIVAGCRGFAMS
jgi:hypothetical protein